MHLQANHYPHQISKEDVDSFESSKYVPACELIVEWDQEDQKPVRLRHKVHLKGAKKPHNYFNLNLNPAWKGNMPTHCQFGYAGIRVPLQ